ncbi:transcription termination factor 1-like isoform X2 [Phycodurus eques]|uniref:transcription termination factor 1-like isoform X2 n=1 Tax=Phycodurus eques TaxID=693459 RepID=UPI002ACDBA56|nr:transcription termination factor 1-like isoform X2 [Phycodurus eques]
MRCSQVPTPVGIPTPNKKKKKKIAQDNSLPPIDALAHKQKKRKPQENIFLPADVHTKRKKRAPEEENMALADVHTTKEEQKKKSADYNNILLLAEGHTNKEKKKKKLEDNNSVLPADKHTHKRKREEKDNNGLPADVPAKKRKKKRKQEADDDRFLPAEDDGDNMVPADVPASKQKKKETEKEMEQTVLLPANGCTNNKKKKIKEANSVFSADEHTRNKEKREEKDNNGLPADVTAKKRKKKRKQEAEDDRFLPAEDDGDNMVPADVPASKQKKKETEKEMEQTVRLPGNDCTNNKKKKIKEANSVFSADEHTRNKEKREEKDNNGLPADVTAKKRKKKRKQEAKDDRFLPADVQKKNKKAQENIILPADVHPHKRKKKKKRAEEENCSPANVHAKKKKKKKAQENIILPADVHPHKRKKKKKRAEEENCSPANVHAKIKKKKKTAEEEEGGVLPPGVHTKKTVMSEVDEVSMATVETEPNKTEKKTPVSAATTAAQAVPVETSEAEEESVIATADDIAVPMETSTTKQDDQSHPVLVAELEEFVGSVKNRPLGEIKWLLRHDLHRFRLFKEQGLSIRWGRFTQEENQRIRDNMAHFLAMTGVSSSDQILFPWRYEYLEKNIKKLKREHGFMEAIAEGIPRPCKQVLTRALKIDYSNHMGQFSTKELHQLVKLQKRHGNDWRRISEMMGRSIYAVQKRFANIASGRGRWTSEEEDRLKEAVKTYLEFVVQRSSAGSKDNGLLRLRQLCANLPWTEISQHVQTRHWCQCRLKWDTLRRLGSRRTYMRPGVRLHAVSVAEPPPAVRCSEHGMESKRAICFTLPEHKT